MQSLEHWKKDTKAELGLKIDKKLVAIEYKVNMNEISQKEEFAKFKSDRSLEARVLKIEADNATMKTEIKVSRVIVLVLATHPCCIL